jgi:hypothetical protein
MMEQLWYSSSLAEARGSGHGKVRATSPGLRLRHRQGGLLPFAEYRLPNGADARHMAVAAAPRGLTLVDHGDERVLAHRVYTGDRTFFSHLLVGSPEELTAERAIQLWASPFWQTSDATLAPKSTMLPAVSLPDLDSCPGTLRGDLLPTTLQQPAVSLSLIYLIQAYIGGGPQYRIFLAMNPEKVAILLASLTRAIPRLLLRDLTFSTYERDVHDSPARIVATCRLPGENRPEPASGFDLPAPCYGPGNYGLNAYTGKKTRLGPREALFESYARFAADQLERGGEALPALLARSEEQRITTPGDLLILYRLHAADIEMRIEREHRAAELAAWERQERTRIEELLLRFRRDELARLRVELDSQYHQWRTERERELALWYDAESEKRKQALEQELHRWAETIRSDTSENQRRGERGAEETTSPVEASDSGQEEAFERAERRRQQQEALERAELRRLQQVPLKRELLERRPRRQEAIERAAENQQPRIVTADTKVGEVPPGPTGSAPRAPVSRSRLAGSANNDAPQRRQAWRLFGSRDRQGRRAENNGGQEP